MGALHGELQPLLPMGALEAIDDVAANLKDRGIPNGLMELGKLGTSHQMYIPWMQATYVLVVNKKALPFLPAGADVNALTHLCHVAELWDEVQIDEIFGCCQSKIHEGHQ